MKLYVLGGALGSLLGKDKKTSSTTGTQHQSETPIANPNVALMFFTPEQYRVTEAAVDRIYPTDENGPGAKDLNAAIYIDHQLAGGYGLNVKDYRLGKFYTPEATQGGQTKIYNKDIFLLGLVELDKYSNQNYTKSFVKFRL